jgi:hypothetical protein
MPRTLRRRRRADPPLLAPRGPPPLPALAPLARTITVFQAQADAAELARSLVRARCAVRRDWDPAVPAPGRMIERTVGRTVERLNRRTPDVLPVCGFIRPWSDVLEELFVECPAGERRWVLGIECEETHRLRVAPVVAALGETAAAVVLDRLLRHTPLCTGGAEDLEWIIDGWYDAAADATEEAEEIQRRAQEATELSGRLDRLLALGRSASLDVLPARRVRRLVEVLAALDRRTPSASDTAWRETDGAEWSLPRPVVHLVWDDGCALEHAVDEAEHVNSQDGSYPMPQHMWLADPADPDESARAWRRWVHALRQSAATARLIGALEALSGSPSSST